MEDLKNKLELEILTLGHVMTSKKIKIREFISKLMSELLEGTKLFRTYQKSKAKVQVKPSYSKVSMYPSKSKRITEQIQRVF